MPPPTSRHRNPTFPINTKTPSPSSPFLTSPLSTPVVAAGAFSDHFLRRKPSCNHGFYLPLAHSLAGMSPEFSSPPTPQFCSKGEKLARSFGICQLLVISSKDHNIVLL